MFLFQYCDFRYEFHICECLLSLLSFIASFYVYLYDVEGLCTTHENLSTNTGINIEVIFKWPCRPIVMQPSYGISFHFQFLLTLSEQQHSLLSDTSRNPPSPLQIVSAPQTILLFCSLSDFTFS